MSPEPALPVSRHTLTYISQVSPCFAVSNFKTRPLGQFGRLHSVCRAGVRSMSSELRNPFSSSCLSHVLDQKAPADLRGSRWPQRCTVLPD